MIGLDHYIKKRGNIQAAYTGLRRKHFVVSHNLRRQFIFYDVISIGARPAIIILYYPNRRRLFIILLLVLTNKNLSDE